MRFLLSTLLLLLACSPSWGQPMSLLDPNLPPQISPASGVPAGSLFEYDARFGVVTSSYPPTDNTALTTWSNFTRISTADLTSSGGSGIYRSSGFGLNGLNPYIGFPGGSPGVSALWRGGALTNVALPYTIIFVGSWSNITTDGEVWQNGSDATVNLRGYFNVGVSSGAGMVVGQITGPATITANTPYVVSTVYKGNNSYVRTNGVLYLVGNIGAYTFGYNGGSLRIGNSVTGSGMGGRFCRFIMYPYELATNDLQSAEAACRADYDVY